MKLFYKRYDGGSTSGVTGYWLIECKKLFSIVLLKFEHNHRENYHNHAFNALTWWVKGETIEHFPDKPSIIWKPSLLPKFTSKSNIHKYSVNKKTTWALTFRGPWNKTWNEYQPTTKEIITLSNGRVKQNRSPFNYI